VKATPKTTREKVINCALVGATLDEIAAYCGITRGTLERRYAREVAQAWARRNVHIRQALTRLALQGNVQALKRVTELDRAQARKETET
jgi:AcrR family transcriptional regulator